MAKVSDAVLGILRRTIIPPLWSIFRRVPGGVRFWTWGVKTLDLPANVPVDAASVQARLVEMSVKFKALFAAVPAPQTSVPLCKLSDLPEFDHPEWTDVAAALGLPTTGSARLTKKYWEYTHVVYGLKQLGCLQPAARALSVGSGFEIPFFYIANQVEHAAGIDLFEGVTDLPAAAEHTERYVAFPVRLGCFTLQRMNARQLEFPDNSFDIVFSLSSIEHFGGSRAAAQAMHEVGRVLKPGGVAAIATELILNGVRDPNFFLPEQFAESVIRPSGLSVIGDIDFSISADLLDTAPQVGETRRQPYIAVYGGRALFTSIMVFLRKP